MHRSYLAGPLARQDHPARAAGQPGHTRFLSSGPDAAGQVTVVVSGDLDLTTTPAFSRYLAAILGRAPRRLVFDMSRAGFVDCAAARLIARTGRHLPGPPVIRRPGRAVLRVLEVTGLAEHCEVADATVGVTAEVTAE